MNLLLERFISVERREPPDIDIDFEHHRREDVMQYIYRKYGRDRAAITGVVTSYRTKSALRDVGKALDFSVEVVECLAKNAYSWDQRWISDACLLESGVEPAAPPVRQWLQLANEVRRPSCERPRKTLNFQTPAEMFNQTVASTV